jgi:type I restriction enzyme S subunit
MIAALKPYEENRDSGSKWIGSIPAHWGVRNLRTLIEKRTERNRADLPLLTVARERGVFVRSLTDASENHNVIPEDLTNYKVARHGNLVINKMKAWQGSMGISPCDGIVSPAYFVFDFHISNHGFGQRLLRSKPYVAHFAEASDGVRVGQWDLSIPGMRQIPVLLPPPEEQEAIVRFLDHAHGRIDRAIRAKRKVIALLNEQKQAIIHKAVTRGLNPDAPLKPSGIPWLGDIPAHWDLFPNRAFLRVRKVLVGKRHPEFTLLSLTKRGVIVRDLSEMRGKFSSDMGTSQEVRSGDLVFCLFDVPETPRTVGLSRHDGMITGAYTVMECKDPEIAQFLELFYIALDDRKLLSPLYSGLRNTIPKDRFLGAKTPIPPTCEREAILSEIRSGTASLDATVTRTEREIELLREYRTRLTADVVTGNLDVREAAKSLPSESPEDPSGSTLDSTDLEPDLEGEEELEEVEG